MQIKRVMEKKEGEEHKTTNEEDEVLAQTHQIKNETESPNKLIKRSVQ